MQNLQQLSLRTLVWGVITLIACIISFYCMDKQLYQYMAQSQSNDLFHSLSKLFSIIFNPKIWLIVMIVSALWVIVQRKQKSSWSTLTVLPIALFISFVVATIMKFGLARYRPEMLQDGDYGFHFFSMMRDNNSFPSGHTTLSCAGLLAFGYFLKNRLFSLIFIIVIIAIAVSRVVIAQHFLSDVLIGLYIGTFAYLWARSCYEHYLQAL